MNQVNENQIPNSITTDPNNIVYNTVSPITSIRNKYKAQINLYEDTKSAYNLDEGLLLRKLLSVFSLRPTITKSRCIINHNKYAYTI